MPKQDKPNIVFILGAGCSQEDQVPLVSDFFDISFNKVMRHLPENERIKFENILNFRENFLPGSDIEQLFSYIDLERYLFPQEINRNLNNIRKDLMFVIAKTIEQNIISGHSQNYKNFYDRHLHGLDKPTVITFNWELLADNTFFEQGVHEWLGENFLIDYGADFHRLVGNTSQNIDREEAPVKLLKLHGSLNWLHCKTCPQNNLFFIPYEKIMPGVSIPCPTCNNPLDTIMVPPSFQKIEQGSELSFLSAIWREAETALINADKIVIVGYSFPDDDVHFKHFFRGALVANYKRIPNKDITIEVVNHKSFSQDKIDFENHYKKILTIPRVRTDVEFVFKKFSNYANPP